MSNEPDDKTIHEELRDVIAATETGESDVSVDEGAVDTAPAATKEVATSDRDEHGRFREKTPEAKKSTESAPLVDDPEKILEAGAAIAGKWSTEKAPTSWSPKSRELWNKLPDEVRREVIKREESAVLGVRHLKERYAPIEAFHKALEPFVTEAKRGGAIPEQYIGNVMTTERLLRTGDLPTKFQTILGIARQYGVPLEDIINKSVGQEVIKRPVQNAAPPVHPEIARELQEMRQWRESLARGQVDQTVEAFSRDPKHEFFEDVRETMADLIEMGRAADMAAAYEQAVWMHPEVREVMLSRQSGKQVANEVVKRQLAAKGASLPNKGAVSVDDDIDGDDLYSTVRSVAMQKSSGRA